MIKRIILCLFLIAPITIFAAGFTPITGGLDWQDVDFVNQIIKGYSERRQVVGDSSVADYVAGADIQDKDVWEDIQLWIDATAVSSNWINHTTSPFTGYSSIPYFTNLVTFRTAASLNSSGWRRATEWVPDAVAPDWETDVTFSYDVMQADDIIGPWIFDDLHKALSTLKWTNLDGNSLTNQEARYGQTNSSPTFTCTDAISDARTEWALGWKNWTSTRLWSTVLRLEGTVSDAYNWNFRSRAKPQLLSAPTVVSCTCDIYLIPTEGFFSYYDFEGTMTTGVLWYFETTAESISSTKTGSLVNDNATMPLDESPYDCGDLPGTYRLTQQVEVTDVRWVMKWIFSHSN